MNKNLKTLLAVGGWVGEISLDIAPSVSFYRIWEWKILQVENESLFHIDTGFWLIGIVKSEKTMKKFAESAIKYLRKHKFDGLDLGKWIYTKDLIYSQFI